MGLNLESRIYSQGFRVPNPQNNDPLTIKFGVLEVWGLECLGLRGFRV